MLIAAILIYGLAGSGNASAAELKIGYVDMRSAIENTVVYRSGMKRLKETMVKKSKALTSLREKIKKIQDDLQGKALAIKPERLSEMQEEITALQKKYSRQQQDDKEELVREKQRMDQGVVVSFRDAVRKYAKSHAYDLVLRKQILLYSSDKYDITAEITKLIDNKK